MSFASYQFFHENATQYMRQLLQIRLRAVLLVQLARRAPAHPAACETRRTLSDKMPAATLSTDAGRTCALQLTERSPRRFMVSNALSCPAFAMPTRMPYCCLTRRIRDRRLHASVLDGQSLVLIEIRQHARAPAPSSSGSSTARRCAWVPSRTRPVCHPGVTSAVQIPLYALARSMYASTICVQVVSPD